MKELKITEVYWDGYPPEYATWYATVEVIDEAGHRVTEQSLAHYEEFQDECEALEEAIRRFPNAIVEV